jgi:hypothetical protein
MRIADMIIEEEDGFTGKWRFQIAFRTGFGVAL